MEIILDMLSIITDGIGPDRTWHFVGLQLLFLQLFVLCRAWCVFGGDAVQFRHWHVL